MIIITKQINQGRNSIGNIFGFGKNNFDKDFFINHNLFKSINNYLEVYKSIFEDELSEEYIVTFFEFINEVLQRCQEIVVEK